LSRQTERFYKKFEEKGKAPLRECVISLDNMFTLEKGFTET